MSKQATRRNNVTVEDRRAALMTAMGRKPAEIARMNHENFIRRMLKERMGWPHVEPAPECVKAAAKEIAGVLNKRIAEEAAARAAKAAQAEAAEKKEQATA